MEGISVLLWRFLTAMILQSIRSKRRGEMCFQWTKETRNQTSTIETVITKITASNGTLPSTLQAKRLKMIGFTKRTSENLEVTQRRLQQRLCKWSTCYCSVGGDQDMWRITRQWCVTFCTYFNITFVKNWLYVFDKKETKHNGIFGRKSTTWKVRTYISILL